MKKRILSVLLSVCILALSLVMPVGAGAIYNADVDLDMGNINMPERTFTMDMLAGKYKVQGRATVINNILMTDYSASGIEFTADCEGDVAITFNATSIISGDEGGCYFTVIVDGVKQVRDFCHITATGDTTVTIAEGLSADVHTFEIYRQTEIERATIGIKSITLTGELLSAPKNNDLYIEFVGDSITTAYGNLTTSGSGVTYSYPKYQDATQGYAYLTAQKLGADWSLIAQQGRGAKYGYTTESLLDIYPKLRYNKDKNTNYGFTREPDYVVIALGTNDINTYASRFSATLDDVKKGFAEMLTLVRSKNPNAKIVWAYNMMTSDANDLITSVIDEAGGADKGYYSVQLSQNTAGGKGHPYYTAHQTMATELADFIECIGNPAVYALGDTNGDETINLNDVVTLAQIVAGWQGVEHIETSLDVNKDNSTDLNDVVLLAQYVAGWDIELGVQLDYSAGVSGVANKTLATYTSSNDLQMPYTLLVPKNYDPAKEYPVLLFFHGADAKGTCNVKPIQKLEPFYKTDAKTMSQAIVLIPQCPQHNDPNWPETNDGWWRYRNNGKGTLNVAMELLEKEVFAKFNCDKNRFYVMGLSMGGEATWETLEQHGDKIAAAVPMCGSRIGNSAFEDATKFKDVPIWIYHGTSDNTIPFSDSETRYNNLIAAGAQNVTFTRLEGYDHDIWSYVAGQKELIKWLFEQKKS